MSLDVILFAVIASATGLSALAVVFSRNIVRSAVWLLFTLVGVSLLYFLLGAEFVGATQLIVYVGGIMVLVVFGVMLTAQQQFLKIRTPGTRELQDVLRRVFQVDGVTGTRTIVVLETFFERTLK